MRSPLSERWASAGGTFPLYFLFIPLIRGIVQAATHAGFSDSGLEHRVFAMVEVVRTQIVIVRGSELDVIETEKHKE